MTSLMEVDLESRVMGEQHPSGLSMVASFDIASAEKPVPDETLRAMLAQHYGKIEGAKLNDYNGSSRQNLSSASQVPEGLYEIKIGVKAMQVTQTMGWSPSTSTRQKRYIAFLYRNDSVPKGEVIREFAVQDASSDDGLMRYRILSSEADKLCSTYSTITGAPHEVARYARTNEYGVRREIIAIVRIGNR